MPTATSLPAKRRTEWRALASQRLPPQSQQPLAHLQQQQEQEEGGHIPQLEGLSLDDTCFGVLHGFRQVAELIESPVTTACRIRNSLQERPILLRAEVLYDAIVAAKVRLQLAHVRASFPGRHR